MSYSFTQIEKDKSSVIGFVLFFLMALYVALIAGFAVLFKCFYISMMKDDVILKWDVFNYVEWTVLIFSGVAAGCFHYFISMSHLTPRVLRWMGSVDPDVKHEKHRIFLNILQLLQ